MPFRLLFTKQANTDMDELESRPFMERQRKAVRKALGYLETNLRHPSLKTHKYKAVKGIGGADVFEAYAENNTNAAYRIFWQYGPEKLALTILGIVAHP